MTEPALGRDLLNRLVDALLRLPGADTREGRDALLTGIPVNVRGGLNRSDNNQFVDLTNLVDQLEQLGRLDNGERPVVIVAHNARRTSTGSELGRRLADLENELEVAYGGDRPMADLPDHPEALIFGGTGEWVSSTFIEQARRAGGRVARLRVPAFADGQFVRPVGGIGTGWLVAPGLLLTNHHVIEARDVHEPPASKIDFARQGAMTEAWFDYHTEGARAATVASRGVLAASRDLDYALLRLEPAEALTGRGHLAVAQDRPTFPVRTRLNIVQCPGGGPLRYAIRNNFFVGTGGRPEHIRYLTDTQHGSSGAPVLDDSWQVVAMHRGYKQVDPVLVAGESGAGGVVKFHNEGVVLTDILADLPEAPRQEIRQAQDWN